MKFIRIILNISFVLLFLIYSKTELQAAENTKEGECRPIEPEYIMSFFGAGFVTIEDVYSLCDLYASGELKSQDRYDEILDEHMTILNRERQYGIVYAVVESNGEYAYDCFYGNPYQSASNGYPYLISVLTLEGITVKDNRQEVQDFVNKNKEIENYVEKQKVYIRQNLKESEYGGIYYHTGDQKIHVFLIAEDKRELLESQNIVCDKGKYSLEQKYYQMNEIWKKRKALGVLYIKMNHADGKIWIYGENEEKVFEQKCREKELNDMPYIYNKVVENISLSNMLGVDEAKEFIQYRRSVSDLSDIDENEDMYWDRVASALKILKETYPEYTCLNLYYHVGKEGDYQSYMGFEEELLQFVDSLPAYQKSSNFLEEAEFGDSERLEVKRLLREYKEKFPDSSYQDIYETYIKNIEENQFLSMQEKTFQYLWKKYYIKKKF